MMLSRKGNENFRPEVIYKVCKKLGAHTVYNPELFPAIYATFEGLPTLVIFRTTSAQALGVKSLNQFINLQEKYSLIITNLHSSSITATI